MNSRGRPRCTLTDLNGTVYHGMFVVFDGVQLYFASILQMAPCQAQT